MRSNRIGLLCGVALAFGSVAALAQDAPAQPQQVKTGPATIPAHWSKYKYPDSIPEGIAYHVVEKGDTLWDIAGRSLGSPYLWPQVWEQNKYVTDAHWIYPGDPLLLPQIDVVAKSAGEGGEGMEDEEEAPFVEAPESVLYPISEEFTIFCAGGVAAVREDESLKLLGHEEFPMRQALADRDIVYLNKGANAGVKAGDLYALHRVGTVVRHPVGHKPIGTRIDTVGRLRVMLVQETSSTAVIEAACMDVTPGDYLAPYQPINVPLAVRRDPATRETPPSGKADGYVIEVSGGQLAAATGNMVTIDLGSSQGVAPGNLLVAYRISYPTHPTPRVVLGELAVVAVRERTATAKIVYSTDAIVSGDRVELR